jgi:hypothetical protein
MTHGEHIDIIYFTDFAHYQFISGTDNSGLLVSSAFIYDAGGTRVFMQLNPLTQTHSRPASQRKWCQRNWR